MVESGENKRYKGRTVTNHIVHFPCQTTVRPGETLKVRITRAGKHSLQGELA